jgi:hypothetical protein
MAQFVLMDKALQDLGQSNYLLINQCKKLEDDLLLKAEADKLYMIESRYCCPNL